MCCVLLKTVDLVIYDKLGQTTEDQSVDIRFR